ncbi:MAG: hypothetical protein Q8N66_05740 [Bacteroidota bacterium]|nr:hypothetical protein [Bacteroidota bacterium]
MDIDISDTISYKIVMEGRYEYKEKPPLVVNNVHEYFDFYYQTYGSYPKDFRFDFDKEMIVVVFKILTSGSFKLTVDYILETDSKIVVVLMPPPEGFRTCDMNPSCIALALKKSDKQIVIN